MRLDYDISFLESIWEDRHPDWECELPSVYLEKGCFFGWIFGKVVDT